MMLRIGCVGEIFRIKINDSHSAPSIVIFLIKTMYKARQKSGRVKRPTLLIVKKDT